MPLMLQTYSPSAQSRSRRKPLNFYATPPHASECKPTSTKTEKKEMTFQFLRNKTTKATLNSEMRKEC